MFSRKPPPKPAAPPPPGLIEVVRERAMMVIANPFLSAGGAAGLFVVTLAALVTLTGNPKAGAPVVRIDLLKTPEGVTLPAGWKQALAPEQEAGAVLSPDTFILSEDGGAGELLPGHGGGEAIITLPGGGRAEGAGPMGIGLPQAPLAGLTAQGPGGLLPIIAADGRASSEAYARPFTANGKPRVALIVGGLGLNAQQTRAAIETLPPEITLSFVPYAEGLQGWIDMARAAGHEVLLEAPMEPSDYPQNDPGPFTLMADAAGAETTRKLEWLLSRATGYFGVTNYLGSKFVNSPAAMTSLATALKMRGLAFVDDGSAARQRASFVGGLPRASAERIVDDQLSAETIEAQLAQLEAGAMQRGQALGSGFAYPVTIETAGRWARSLPDRGFQLAPASALMKK